jgi:hypothetical protein
MFPGPNLSKGLPHPGWVECYWGNFLNRGWVSDSEYT